MNNKTYPKLNVTLLLLGIGYHMLQFIRSKVTSIFIKVLFGILILSFAIWGIGDIFLGQDKGETTVSVGDIDYNSDDITREFERTRKAMRLPPEYVALVKPQILESVINNLVNNGMAFRDAYLKVSDDIKKNNFIPNKKLDHTLKGSLGNLCLKEIKLKMEKTMNLN